MCAAKTLVTTDLRARRDDAGNRLCELCWHRLSRAPPGSNNKRVSAAPPGEAHKACLRDPVRAEALRVDLVVSRAVAERTAAGASAATIRSATDAAAAKVQPPKPASGTFSVLQLHQQATWPTHQWTLQTEYSRHSGSTAAAWRQLAASDEWRQWEEKRGRFWQHDARQQLQCSCCTTAAAVQLPGRAAREARLCQRGDRSTAAALTGSGYQQPPTRLVQATAHANG